MIVQDQPPLQLTYCLNVHPGESLAEITEAIQDKTLAIRHRVSPAGWFGLGLRFGIRAARELSDRRTRQTFKEFLDAHQLYTFTLNGFPYGDFHGARVKEAVYAPDWRTEERRDYTILLADILADLLPDGMSGSISTVPGSFKTWVNHPDDPMRMARRLAETAAYLVRLEQQTGREIVLGLEPEPGCYLETTGDFVQFFNGPLLHHGLATLQTLLKCNAEQAEAGLRRHLGFCLDTCHLAMQFENVEQAIPVLRGEGIRLAKVQLSAGLQLTRGRHRLESLDPFAEPVYLHQVQARLRNGDRRSWLDLFEARAALAPEVEWEELRVHFHVPLFWTESGGLASTSAGLDDRFFHLLCQGVCPHLEIETYTFAVLPNGRASADIAESISREYEWALARLNRNAAGRS